MHLVYLREVLSNLSLLIHLLLRVAFNTGVIFSIPCIYAAEKFSKWDRERHQARVLTFATSKPGFSGTGPIPSGLARRGRA